MENNNLPQNQSNRDLKEKVLEKIREGKVHMRPRFYFFLKIAFLIALAAIIFITSALLLSFIFFSFRLSGELFLLGFGFRGIEAFFMLFPWKTLLLFVLLLLILEKVIKRFKFGYRSPLIYLVGGMVALVLACVFLISLTSFHNTLLRRARNHTLPVVGDYYIHARRVPKEQGVVRGMVTGIHNNSFTIQNDIDNEISEMSTTSLRGSLINVFVPPTIPLNSLIHVGDEVFVAGTVEKDGIHAYGIKKMIEQNEE